MEIEVVKDPAKFAQMRSEWNEAAVKSSGSVFFLTHEWLYTWWEKYGLNDDLFIVTVRDKGSLVAAAPLMIRTLKYGCFKVKQLQFIAHEVSDYMDFIMVKDKESCFHLIADKIFESQADWDVAEFIYLMERSDLYSLWRQNLRADFAQDIKAVDVSVTVDLSVHEGFDSYLRSMDKKVRSDVSRQENNLSKQAPVTLKIFTEANQILPVMSSFYSIHKKRWEQQGFASQFDDITLRKRYESLCSELSGSGLLELGCLYVGEDVAALAFCFVFNARDYYYTPAFNPDYERFSPGKILVSRLIKSCIERRIKVFDLLRGGEKYKFFWAKDKAKLYRITLAKKTPKAVLYFLFKHRLRPVLAGVKTAVKKVFR